MVRDVLSEEQRVVVRPLPPPPRLAPGARYRSFKKMTDRGNWDAYWSRVTELTDDGWTLDRVEVDFGEHLPLHPNDVTAWLASLCDGAQVEWTRSGRGKGETRAYLTRIEKTGARGDRVAWVWGDEEEPSALYRELERRRGY